jgi:hypothetical protein
MKCFAPSDSGRCESTGNSPPEDDPRYCNACPEGQVGLFRIYGKLPVITYQPGWNFGWSCANGLLFLHCMVGEPNSKGFCSRTGQRRGTTDSMWITGLPLDTEWLRDMIAQMEEHERHEWLKVNGIAPFYPHCLHEGEIDKEVPGRKHCAVCDDWFDVGPDGKQCWTYGPLTKSDELVVVN